jgi:hypothetical protein
VDKKETNKKGGNMKALKWYGAVVTGYLQIYFGIDILQGRAEDVTFWCFIIFAPILTYFVMSLIKGEKK